MCSLTPSTTAEFRDHTSTIYNYTYYNREGDTKGLERMERHSTTTNNNKETSRNDQRRINQVSVGRIISIKFLICLRDRHFQTMIYCRSSSTMSTNLVSGIDHINWQDWAALLLHAALPRYDISNFPTRKSKSD